MSTSGDGPVNQKHKPISRPGPTRRNPRDPPVIDEEAARDLVSSLFFGVMAPPESSSSSTTTTKTDKESSVRDSTSISSSHGTHQDGKARKSQKKSPKQEEDPKAFTAKVTSALRIHEHIPEDPAALREKPIFQNTYKLLQWQRDNYLVGKDYADWRKAERQQEAKLGTKIVRDSTGEIAIDPTALGHQQIAKLASDFIPSETVRKTALPLVVGLPQKGNSGGALYQPTRTALVDLIDGQQDNLNRLLKNQILIYLQNPQNRLAMKNSTQGFIATQYPSRNSATNTNQQQQSDAANV